MIQPEPINALDAVRARPRSSRRARASQPVAGPWLAPGSAADAPPLVPLLAAADDLTPEVDRALTKVALAARAGDRAARDALYLALQAKIARFVARYTAWDRAPGSVARRPAVARRGSGPRRLPHPRRSGRRLDGRRLLRPLLLHRLPVAPARRCRP